MSSTDLINSTEHDPIMSAKVSSEPLMVPRQRGDPQVLFTSLVSSFFQFTSALISCLSFLCLFLSFLFSSLFNSLSHLSVLFFTSLNLQLPAQNPGIAKPALEGAAKAAKEGDKAADKKGAKEPEKKDGDKGTEKKEVPKGGDKKEGDKADDKKEPPKETTVVMKVPICESCQETVRLPLKQMAGVKSVECDTRREKVTVVATTATPTDILVQCVKVFSTARMWRDGD